MTPVPWFAWPWMMPVWSILSPTVNIDVRADNWDYAPMTEWGEGDLVVEDRVKREVATPGRQLGILSDAVLELAGRVGALDGEAVQKLDRLVAEVERIKAECGRGSTALTRS